MPLESTRVCERERERGDTRKVREKVGRESEGLVLLHATCPCPFVQHALVVKEVLH